MNAFGLIEHWIKFHQAMPHKCLAEAAQKQAAQPRLSLKNLTGAFIILLAGYVLSITVFIVEYLSAKQCPRIRHHSTPSATPGHQTLFCNMK